MNALVREAKHRLGTPLLFVAAMWVVFFADLILPGTLNALGIRPRQVSGLWGILFSPFLHASLGHLLANTVPFLILGWMVALRGTGEYLRVTLFVMLVGGSAVWLLGRPGTVHVGASGVVFGYLGFLLARGFFERSAQAVIVSLVALFLYGGVLWGVLPTSARVSWEGHLFGALAGIGAARLFTRRPTPRARTRTRLT